MDPELQKFIIENLNQSKDFVLSQAPDVIQQYLLAHEIDAGIGIVAASIGLVMAVAAVLYSWFKTDDGGDTIFVSGVFGALVGPICSVLLICSCSEFIQIKYAPKGYLLEKLVHK